MPAASLAIEDKRAFVQKTGSILLKKYGVKTFYTPNEIKEAAIDSGYSFEFISWVLAIYASRDDFDSFHQTIGETYNYAKMRIEMENIFYKTPPNSREQSADIPSPPLEGPSWIDWLLDLID